MKLVESRLLWGGLLVLAGVLFLAQNLGILEITEFFWALVFAITGGFFLYLFALNRVNWWTLIPGSTLLGLGALAFVNWVAPEIGIAWGGSIVLGGIGLGFLLIYLAAHQNWWALIPAGVLFTLALAAGVDQASSGIDPAGLFFCGLGLTFAMVALLPTPSGDMRWAWIPCLALLFIGGIFLLKGQNLLNLVWPAGLILLGGFLVFRALRRT